MKTILLAALLLMPLPGAADTPTDSPALTKTCTATLNTVINFTQLAVSIPSSLEYDAAQMTPDEQQRFSETIKVGKELSDKVEQYRAAMVFGCFGH